MSCRGLRPRRSTGVHPGQTEAVPCWLSLAVALSRYFWDVEGTGNARVCPDQARTTPPSTSACVPPPTSESPATASNSNPDVDNFQLLLPFRCSSLCEPQDESGTCVGLTGKDRPRRLRNRGIGPVPRDCSASMVCCRLSPFLLRPGADGTYLCTHR